MVKSLSAPSRPTATVPFTGAPVWEFTMVPEMDVALSPPPAVDPLLPPDPVLEPPPEPALPPDPAPGAVEAEGAGDAGCVLFGGVVDVVPQPVRSIPETTNIETKQNAERRARIFTDMTSH